MRRGKTLRKASSGCSRLLRLVIPGLRWRSEAAISRAEASDRMTNRCPATCLTKQGSRLARKAGLTQAACCPNVNALLPNSLSLSLSLSLTAQSLHYLIRFNPPPPLHPIPRLQHGSNWLLRIAWTKRVYLKRCTISVSATAMALVLNATTSSHAHGTRRRQNVD